MCIIVSFRVLASYSVVVSVIVCLNVPSLVR